MPALSFQENLIQNIFMLEAVSRIAMSALYGFALLSFGYTLSLRAREKKHSEKFHNLARILFGFASVFTIIYATLEFVLPINSVTTQVYTAICLVLAITVLFLDKGKEGFPAFSFLVGALIFLMATITPFVDPKPLYRATSADWLVNFHIGTAALGEAIFVVSFCASLLYLSLIHI